ncbi:MAG: TonB-dependent receptor plug domain-containing protein, partial [Candidatus Kapabacteria bacterium]|nr:TonB-dependent receptor plug domain-containing protein [Candidatus Kapabacteria bacterium]
TEGNYTLSYSCIGHTKEVRKIQLNANSKLNIQLISSSNTSQSVVVTAEKKNDNVSNPQIGVEKVELQSIRNVPVLFGERDVLKTIQLLPGVKSAGEGNSGFSVRGGNTDQNLILLDEAPVYNASHLLGFFSTFNSDAIKDVTLYKAGMPSNYGGRISSVLDIKMNEGNAKKFGGNGGIGLISSKLLIEGPIQEDVSSFLIAGRRTYADIFLKLSSEERLTNSSLYFYDLNAKANYKFGENDRVFLSGYFGRDVLGFNNTFGIDWGNTTGTLRWNHVWDAQLISNSSFIYSNYDYNIGVNFGGVDFDIYSQIQDWNFKQEFEYFPNPENSIQCGVNIIHHTIVPGTITVSGDDAAINSRESQKQYSLEGGLFATHKWKANDDLTIEYGARLSTFSVLGGSTQYTLDANRNVVDTIKTQSGEILKTYMYVEPRVSLSYLLNESSSMKASYVRNTQGLHLLSNSTTSSPTDRWVSSNNNILPQVSNQFSAGYFKNFSLDEDAESNEYELGIETYYKDMQNQIDYKDGAQLNG